MYRRIPGATTLAHQAQVAHGDVNAGAVLMRIDVERLPAAFATEVAKLRQSLDGPVAVPPLPAGADLRFGSSAARPPSVTAAAVRHAPSTSASDELKRVGH